MPGVRKVPEDIGEQGQMEKTGSKIICGAPTTLAVKELMMMMMNHNPRIDLRVKGMPSTTLTQNTASEKARMKCCKVNDNRISLSTLHEI